MKMTTAMWAQLVFATLLSYGGYDTFATSIISALGVLDVSSFATKLVVIGSVSAFVTLTTRLFAGQAPITTPAVVFMISIIALPTGVITASQMPQAIKYLVTGFWAFITISGVGGAIRGDF